MHNSPTVLALHALHSPSFRFFFSGKKGREGVLEPEDHSNRETTFDRARFYENSWSNGCSREKNRRVIKVSWSKRGR